MRKAHVHLNIGRVDPAVDFYVKLFGVQPLRRRPGAATFDVHDPALFLVVQEEPRTGVNAGHFGILVASREELELADGALRARGLEPERRDGKLWLEDPDGNAWEVLVAPT